MNPSPVMPQKLGAKKHQRAENKATSHQLLTRRRMASFILSICFAASSRISTRWISLAFVIDMFSSFSLLSVYCMVFLSPHPHQDDSSRKRSCHTPLLNFSQDTCLLQRMKCVMKASFLWENWLSTVTSFPSELITEALPSHLSSWCWHERADSSLSDLGEWGRAALFQNSLIEVCLRGAVVFKLDIKSTTLFWLWPDIYHSVLVYLCVSVLACLCRSYIHNLEPLNKIHDFQDETLVTRMRTGNWIVVILQYN